MSTKSAQYVNVNRTLLEKVCASQRWQTLVLRSTTTVPTGNFAAKLTKASLYEIADKAFCQLEEGDWLEAFSGHPMIGDLSSLKQKYTQGKKLSETEQSQVADASDSTLQSLLALNKQYLDKFGFIFIVCATNKSAQEMLDLLTIRINNNRTDELLNASIEQRKISQLRLEGLVCAP